MIRLHLGVIVSLILALFLSSRIFPVQDAVDGKLAFLRDGQIWIADPDATNQALLLAEKNEIGTFLFSPSLTLVAYARIIGKRDDEAPDSDICETVICSLQERIVLAELKATAPSDGDSLRPWRWFSDSRLVVMKSSGFDVAGADEYDLDSGTRNALSQPDIFDTIVSGSLLWHTKDSGLGPAFRMTLFEKNLETGREIELASKRTIYTPTLSPDKGKLAYVEVDNAGQKDTIWTYERKTSSERDVYTGQIGGKSEGFLYWSPDSRLIAVRYTNRSNIIVDTSSPAAPDKIPWRFATWLTNNTLLMGRGREYKVFHVDTKMEEFLIGGISAPILLARD